MTFQEIKTFFETNDIPDSLVCDYMTIPDLKRTIDTDIAYIEFEIGRRGEKIKRCYVANAAKCRLEKIIKILNKKV